MGTGFSGAHGGPDRHELVCVQTKRGLGAHPPTRRNIQVGALQKSRLARFLGVRQGAWHRVEPGPAGGLPRRRRTR